MKSNSNYDIDIYQIYPDKKSANITKPSLKRDWIQDSGPYYGLPMSIMLQFGFFVSFPEDISFTWNGNFEKSNAVNKKINSIEVHEGKEFIYLDRGIGTVSFSTNLMLETKDDVSLMTLPVPNQFIDGVHCYSTALSTSFFPGELHVVWKITRPDHRITIKSGTPVAIIVPISLKQFENVNAFIHDEYPEHIYTYMNQEYSDSLKSKPDTPSGFYRKATDHLGKKVGKHELLNFKFNVFNNSINQ